MPTCKLCKNDRKLISAHIIPRAFYAPPSPEGAAKILANKEGTWPRKAPIGVYDASILCEDCDGALGKLDQHAAEQLLQGKPTKEVMAGANQQVVARYYGNADASKMLLFIASIIWRASISSHEFFSRVELGPYEDILRSMLLGHAEESDRVDAILAEFDTPAAPILDPHSTRFAGVNFWVVYASRYVLYLKLDRRGVPDPFAELALRRASEVISTVRSWEGSKELSVMQKIVVANPNAFPKKK
jgi:hypothetical protein